MLGLYSWPVDGSTLLLASRGLKRRSAREKKTCDDDDGNKYNNNNNSSTAKWPTIDTAQIQLCKITIAKNT
jgi:hypothetical protein